VAILGLAILAILHRDGGQFIGNVIERDQVELKTMKMVFATTVRSPDGKPPPLPVPLTHRSRSVGGPGMAHVCRIGGGGTRPGRVMTRPAGETGSMRVFLADRPQPPGLVAPAEMGGQVIAGRRLGRRGPIDKLADNGGGGRFVGLPPDGRRVLGPRNRGGA
jgi:hypothetical protein